MSSPMVDKLVAKGAVPLYFIQCKDRHGRDCYYYLISTPQKIQHYERVRSGHFDLNDFGEVVAHGYGTAPSDEVRQLLQEKYGITP